MVVEGNIQPTINNQGEVDNLKRPTMNNEMKSAINVSSKRSIGSDDVIWLFRGRGREIWAALVWDIQQELTYTAARQMVASASLWNILPKKGGHISFTTIYLCVQSIAYNSTL